MSRKALFLALLLFSCAHGQGAPALYEQPSTSSGSLLLSASWDGSDYDRHVWDNFTLPAGGEISAIGWRGGHEPSRFGSGGPVLGFTISIYASNPSGTEPDVGSYNGGALMRQRIMGATTGVPAGTIAGTPVFDYLASLPVSFHAAAGTKYWLQIEALQGGPVDWGLARAIGGDGTHFEKFFSGSTNMYRAMPGDATFALFGPAGGTPIDDANRARLINLSVLTSLGAGDEFTLGYALGGSGCSGLKPLLVRAAGPALASLGVIAPHGNPRLHIQAGAASVGDNDDWGGTEAIMNATARVGAFPFGSAASLDAAFFHPAAPIGNSSIRVDGVGAASGAVLAELYDATPSSAFTPTTPRLVNISVLKDVGAGIAAGFVIGGGGNLRVLIRAVGPTLGEFGVEGALGDPRLTVFDGSQEIVGGNDDWMAADAGLMGLAGAFALPGGSTDAALVATLAPGSYTVHVAGAGDSVGLVLLELYEVP